MAGGGRVNVYCTANQVGRLFLPPVGGAFDCWTLGFEPRCAVGDAVLFRFQSRVVARAVICKVEQRFNRRGEPRGWAIVWESSTFEDLRHGEHQGLVVADSRIPLPGPLPEGEGGGSLEVAHA